jgi:hypothetical protein
MVPMRANIVGPPCVAIAGPQQGRLYWMLFKRKRRNQVYHGGGIAPTAALDLPNAIDFSLRMVSNSRGKPGGSFKDEWASQSAVGSRRIVNSI